jgi:hypothetical protein
MDQQRDENEGRELKELLQEVLRVQELILRRLEQLENSIGISRRG